MPKTIIFPALAALAALGAWLLVSYVLQSDTGEEDGVTSLLVQTSEELNRRLPDMVDENTVLEATSGSNTFFSYFYTLLNYSIDDVDVDAFVKRMQPELVKGVCGSIKLQEFLDLGVSIRHVYSDKDRIEFTSISITPADCTSTD